MFSKSQIGATALGALIFTGTTLAAPGETSTTTEGFVPQSAFSIDSSIDRISNGTNSRSDDYSTVDYISFSVLSAGDVTIDILSWEVDSFSATQGYDATSTSALLPRAIDVNGDGNIAFFDTHMRLFTSDGQLDAGDFLADSDNASSNRNGSISNTDSMLTVYLEPGDYIIAVGASNLSMQDAISGMNTNLGSDGPMTFGANGFEPSDSGTFRATITGSVSRSGTVVPMPSALALGIGGLLATAGLRRRR